jgi:hypothetical protein
MKRRLKLKKQNMKTQILLTTIGAAVLAAITLNVNAGTTLLSPRAQGNQIKVVPGVTAAQPASAAQSIAPRALGNQTTTVNGIEPAVTKCPAAGNPKYLATVGSSARTTCCKSTLAECPTMSGCGNAK